MSPYGPLRSRLRAVGRSWRWVVNAECTEPYCHQRVVVTSAGGVPQRAMCVHGNDPLTCDHRPDGPCISAPDSTRECARILMALVDSGKSWLQDVNGVETAVIGVTDAAKLLSGFAS